VAQAAFRGLSLLLRPYFTNYAFVQMQKIAQFFSRCRRIIDNWIVVRHVCFFFLFIFLKKIRKFQKKRINIFFFYFCLLHIEKGKKK